MRGTGLVAALVMSGAVLAAQQPTFKSGARTVAVYATVAEDGGRLVTGLTRGDFEVKDNGKPQNITIFSADPQPISVVVMLDRSGSMEGNYRLLELAAEAFVHKLGPDDKARIGSFAEKVQIDPEDFTSDKQTLVSIIRTKLQRQGPTPLWNAIDAAIDALRTQDGRRVVLVFSDGADQPGNFKLNNNTFMDTMLRAQRENVMVYAVGLESSFGAGTLPRMRGGIGSGGLGGGFGRSGFETNRPDPGLAAIAEETGGGYFELERAEDLEATFARVADELHHQYLLGFEPQKLDGKMHKLQVKVRRDGMKVRARQEYHAAQ